MKTKLLARLLVLVPAVFVSPACAHNPDPPKPPEEIRIEKRSRMQGWLGVSIEDMTSKMARKKGIKTEEGAYVQDVEPDSPADSAGIKDGDVIVEFDGKRIDDAADLTKAVRRVKPGVRASVSLLRGSDRKTLPVTVGRMPRRLVSRISPPGFGPQHFRVIMGGSSLSGLQLRTLNEQLGEYFDAPGKKGALVERVEKNSAAEKAGFKAGDVVIKAGKEGVEDVGDFQDAVGDYDEGEKVDIEVVRKGSRKTLTLEIEEDRDAHGYHYWFDRRPHGEMLEEMDIEIPEITAGQLRIESENLKHNLDGMSHRMKGWGEKFRREMHDMQEQLRRELRSVNKSVTL